MFVNKFKHFNNLFSLNLYLILFIFLSFYLIRIGFKFPLFIYPFLMFLIIKKNKSILLISLFFFVIGMSLVFFIYFWFKDSGLNYILLGMFLSGLVFFISGLLSSIIKRYNQLNNDTYLILFFSFSLYFMKILFFSYFYNFSYFLEAPIVLTFYLNFIPNSILYLILFISSILFFNYLFIKSYLNLSLISTVIIIIFIIPIIINSMNPTKLNNVELIKVATIQGNFNQNIAIRSSNSEMMVKYYINKTISANKQGAKIIIWPEYAVLTKFRPYTNLINYYDPSLDSRIILLLKNLSKSLDIILITGYYELDENNNIYDSALVFDPDKGLLPMYKAHELYLDSNMKKKGNDNIVYKTKYGNFFIQICFESFIRNIMYNYKSMRNKIDFMVVLANNQFLKDSQVLENIIWNYQLMSGEMNLPLISSTNTGPTSFISNQGQILSKLDTNVEGILYSNIEIKKVK